MPIIDSNVDDFELSLASSVAGPEPEGSKLTREERLHLIVRIADLREAVRDGNKGREDRVKEALQAALLGRGLRSHHIADTFRDMIPNGSPVSVANAFSVHPALKGQG